MKHLIITFLLVFIVTPLCLSQERSEKSVLNEKKSPVWFLDDKKIDDSVVQTMNPDDIAAITVLKEASAIKALGEEGKNGVVYIYSIPYACKKYIAYFRTKSPDYARLISTPEDEKEVVYVLNGKVLERKNAGDLFVIDDESFIDLKVIDSEQVKANYQLDGKKAGIIILTKQKPKQTKQE